MGFGGNRNERGHDIALVESFIEHGYVIQLEPSNDVPRQYPANSSLLENYSDYHKRKITDKHKLRLSQLSFEEAKQHIE